MQNNLLTNRQVIKTSSYLLIAAVMPFIFYLNWWVWVYVGIVICLQTLYLQQKTKANNTVLLIGAAICFLLVYLSFNTFLGRDPGVHLFLMILALKYLEMKTQRDVMVFAVLINMLIVWHFLYSQAILSLIYALLLFVFTNAFLISFQDALLTFDLHKSIKKSLALFIQAFPLAILIFVIFPRQMLPLWSLPVNVNTTIRGLQDKVEPGQISDLLNSGSIVFRARIENSQELPKEKLYWRAKVFDTYDGKSWFSSARYLENKIEIQDTKNFINYNVTIEPHGQNWLPAIDLPVTKKFNYAKGLTISLSEPLKERKYYELTSVLDYKFEPNLQKEVISLYTGIIPDINKKTRELVKELQNNNKNKYEFINSLKDYFLKNEFYYTITPPKLRGEQIDDFLFHTQSGYCEHYASALAFMLRLADIPSRVVIGYLGGEYNNIDNYYIVYDYDAHAWVEAFLPGEGWVRLDPTSWLAPARVQLGLDALFASLRKENKLSAEDINYFPPINRQEKIISNKLRLFVDAINFRWYEWVISYNKEKQKSIFNGLGINALNRLHQFSIILAAIIIFFGIFSLCLLYKKQTSKKHPLDKEFANFCAKMKNLGFKKEAWEGAKSYAFRISKEFPNISNEIRDICIFYQYKRYCAESFTNHELLTFRKNWQQLVNKIQNLNSQ